MLHRVFFTFVTTLSSGVSLAWCTLNVAQSAPLGILRLWCSPHLLVFHRPGVLQMLDSTTLGVVIFIHYWVHGDVTDLAPSL